MNDENIRTLINELSDKLIQLLSIKDPNFEYKLDNETKIKLQDLINKSNIILKSNMLKPNDSVLIDNKNKMLASLRLKKLLKNK